MRKGERAILLCMPVTRKRKGNDDVRTDASDDGKPETFAPIRLPPELVRAHETSRRSQRAASTGQNSCGCHANDKPSRLEKRFLECAARARLQMFLKSNRRRSLGEVYRDKNSPGTVLGGVMRKTGVVALEAPFRTIRSETHIMPRRIREAFEHVNTGSHVQDRAALTRYRTSRVFVLRADFASNWEADFA